MKGVGEAVSGIIGVIVVAGLVLWFMNRDKSGEAPRVRSFDQIVAEREAGERRCGDRIELTKKGTDWTEGIAINENKSRARFVRIAVDLFDDDRNVVDEAFTIIRTLDAGQRWAYRMPVVNSRATRAGQPRVTCSLD